MIKDVKIKKLLKNEDRRGWLVEIYREDEDGYRPAMSYVSVTKPGVIRGPHEHIQQTDCFVFIGPGSFELHLWDKREDSPTNGEYFKEIFGENNPAAIFVPPGVVHGYKCVSENDGWCINLPNKLYKGERKKEEVDEIRWEGNQDSPYKIN
ncbi:dTDP-4-dehydrorhamnose 3,5-epimerase family protein [Patescibacteria group bacterium]|nr:dTDP-4-dehydrorhamnose 3,5-epimerase family protein [Patescibacteria group bacterium]